MADGGRRTANKQRFQVKGWDGIESGGQGTSNKCLAHQLNSNSDEADDRSIAKLSLMFSFNSRATIDVAWFLFAAATAASLLVDVMLVIISTN